MFFEVDINSNGISCNCNLKIDSISLNKGEWYFFDKHMLFVCRTVKHQLKIFKYDD